jgi:hypothetical protein
MVAYNHFDPSEEIKVFDKGVSLTEYQAGRQSLAS